MADMEKKDYRPLLTNLTPNDDLTVEDIELIFNLSDEDISRIALMRPNIANNAYRGRTERERIVNHLIGTLLPSRRDDNHPTGLTDSEMTLVDSYIRGKNAGAIYELIVSKTTPSEKRKSSITEDFKFIDKNGHYREKRIPSDKPLGIVPEAIMTPIPADVDENNKPKGNKAVYAYLTSTRGLSRSMVNFLIDNCFVYQGMHFFQADRKRIKKSDKDVAAQIKKLTKHNVMVINGFVDNDDPNGVPVFQSARETWDVWDDYHTSDKFLKLCEKRPDCMYEGFWKKENGEFVFHKKIKVEASRDAEGKIIRDSNKQIIWKEVHDENGNPVYEIKKPLKEDNINSDKEYTWRLPNPKSDTLYIFEAPLDCWSYIDMLVQNKEYYTPSGSIDTSKLANFLSIGGLNYTSIRSFLYDHPNINKIYLCFDNDKSGKEAANKFAKMISEQYNIPQDHVIPFTCPAGYQKLDAHYVGMRDENNNMVQVKDYNELLRAWVGADHTTKNMARIADDYAKDNKLGKYGTQEYQISEKVKQSYTQAVQNHPGAKQSFPNIPSVPEKRGGIVTAALYRDETRTNMRTSVINSIRDDGLTAQEKYKQLANRAKESSNSSAPVAETPSEPDQSKIINGDER